MSTVEGSVQLHVLNPSRQLILPQAVAIAEWNLPNVMAYKGETVYISSTFFFPTNNANFIIECKEKKRNFTESIQKIYPTRKKNKTTKFLKSLTGWRIGSCCVQSSKQYRLSEIIAFNFDTVLSVFKILGIRSCQMHHINHFFLINN